MYLFSGSDDPVGQRLDGVRALVDRYRGTGLTFVDLQSYQGGRHEMLHELNRREVFADLLAWMSERLGAES
jgi:alpha-beta hydrolase superfamily lysophospholipase